MDACGGKRGGGFILPTLLKHLKGILEQYPDDGQILKELIQNADDAKARRVCFLYDKTSYGSSTLADAGLAKFQGPALYAYNDATFTEQDWEGIRMLSDSKKANDKMKVGRFGLGFKSVFHLTDMPGLLSGDGLVFYEPHEDFFTEVDSRGKTQRTATKEYDLRDFHSLYLGDMRDQLEPFIVPEFGATEEALASGQYRGTIFRFPLRTPNHNSELSPVVYDDTKICGLLDTLRAQPEMALLFLKYIEKIEVYEKNSGQPAQLLFSTRISDSSAAEVREIRTEFLSAAESRQGTSGTCDAVVMPYQFSITTTVRQNRRTISRGHSASYQVPLQTSMFKEGSMVTKETDWLIIQHLAGGREVEEALTTTFKSLKQLPWVGAAVQITPEPSDVPKGHVFCFLPLPLQERSPTGLHAHINGYFAVAQNRRHLKWASADASQQNVDDLDILWNKFLVSQVVGMALAELIMYCVKRNMDPSIVYSLFPNKREVEPQWKQVIQKVYSIILPQAVFYTPVNEGRWLTLPQAVFYTSDQGYEIVQTILLRGGVKLVSPPHHVEQAVEKYSTSRITRATPQTLRAVLKQKVRICGELDWDQRNTVLSYVLSDGDTRDLIGIQNILMLHDGTQAGITQPDHRRCVFIGTDEVVHLLPGLEGKFLSTQGYSTVVRDALKQVAQSGLTNLKMFDIVGHFPELLPLVFPNSCRNQSTLSIRTSSLLSHSWCSKVWQFLVSFFPDHLDRFEGLHLIPAGQSSLVRMNRSCQVIRKTDSRHYSALPDAVVRFLSECGAVVLEKLSVYHPQIDQYIASPNLRGVLLCLASLRLSDCKTYLRNSHNDTILDIRRFCSYGVYSLNGRDLQVLRQLPIFTLLNTDSRRCSSEEVSRVACYSNLSFKVHFDIIALDRDVKVLADKLNLEVLSENRFWRECVFAAIHNKRYSPGDIQAIMSVALDTFYTLYEEDNTIAGDIKNIPFLKTRSGALVQPSKAFNCGDEALVKLFDGVGHIPDDTTAANHNMMQKLLIIGLKTRNAVKMDDLTSVANHIASMSQSRGPTTELLDKAKCLLHFLDESSRFHGQLHHLRGIPWMPVARQPPSSYPSCLSWAGDNTVFCRPDEAFDMQYSSLLGSVATLIDLPEQLRELCSRSPSFGSVLTHMENVTGAASGVHGAIVTRVMIDIYSWLNGMCQNNRLTEENILHLRQSKFINIQGNFYIPRNCSRFSEPCPPYFQTIDGHLELESFTQLWTTLGIKDHFEADDLAGFLKKIYEQQRHTNQHDIKCALRMIKLLAETMIDTNTTHHHFEDLYVPGQDERMHPATDLCYNNCPWVNLRPDMTFCHPDISFGDAEVIGVKTIRAQVLQEFSSPLGEVFGQKEDLTSRINRLLTGYPFGIGVIYELLQNADDAGATEIHFVLDKRSHPTERVFDECWEPLQGPALLVYNNKPFSPGDIAGIQKLGMGSKSSDPTKTGQYGVGFNCVYHLTDTPTIYTDVIGEGKVLCAFDPHCLYVPGATPDRPGRKFSNIADLEQRFPDVFTAYLPDLLTVDGGTVFRFPLRTRDQAAVSDIVNRKVNKHITPDQIQRLFSSFSALGSSSLLFLNNLVNVKMSVVEADGSLNEYNDISMTQSEEEKREKARFASSLRKAGQEIKQGSVKRIPEATIDYTLTLRNGIEEKKWMVVQTVGFSRSISLGDGITAAYRNQEMTLVPRGGVAIPLDANLGQLQDGSLFSILPLPLSTYFPLHINGHFALVYENRGNLVPAKMSEGSLSSTWNCLLFRDVICRAYARMLLSYQRFAEATGFEIYHQLFPLAEIFEKDSSLRDFFRSTLQHIADNNVECLPVAVSHHPDTNEIHWYSPLTENFHYRAYYNDLDQQIPHIRPKHPPLASRRLCPPPEPAHVKLTKVLKIIGFPLLISPMAVHESFLKAERVLPLVSPQSVLQFLQRYREEESKCIVCRIPIPVDQSPFESVDGIESVIKYCLKKADDQEPLPNLHAIPLLVTQDKILRCFDEDSPVFLSEFSDLFPKKRAEFLHGKFNSHLQKLLEEDSTVLRVFSVEDMASFMPSVLRPKTFKGKQEVAVATMYQALGGQKQGMKWLYRLWVYLIRVLDQKNINHQSCMTVWSSVLSWNLLPVNRGGQVVLIKLSGLNMVMNFTTGDTTSFSLRETFRSMPFLSLDINHLYKSSDGCSYVFQSDPYSVMSQLTGNIDQPASIINALYHMSEAELHSIRGSKKIREYFANNLEGIKQLGHVVLSVLKKLKIYESKSDSHTLCNLSGRDCYMLSSDLPVDEISVFQSDSAERFVLFLTTPSNKEEKALLENLGVKEVSDADFYIDFCLVDSHFTGLMSERGRLVHLRYIRDNLLTEECPQHDRDRLLDCLRKLAFVQKSDNSFSQACEFYNSNIRVFACFGEQVIPEPFSELEWTDFMINCGMVSTISQSMFLKYARQVERQAALPEESDNDRLEHLKDAAVALIEHMYEMFTKRQYGTNMLRAVKDIAFVPPCKVSCTLASVCPQFNTRADGSLPYLKFSGSCEPGAEELIWTTTGIIGHSPPTGIIIDGAWVKTNRELMFQSLNINMKGTIQPCVIVTNIIKLCSHLKCRELNPMSPLIENIRNVLHVIYRQISSTFAEYPASEVNKLKKAAIIAVEGYTQFVTAQDIFIELTDDIPPYIYCLPLDLGVFQSLLKSLGSSSFPTAAQYADVVNILHENIESRNLVPNEIFSVVRLLNGLYGQLKREKLERDITVDTIHVLALPHIVVTYSPPTTATRGCSAAGDYIRNISVELFKSTKMVYNDTGQNIRLSRMERRVFAHISRKDGFIFTVRDLMAVLPDRLKPVLLSTVLKEEITDAGMEVECEDVTFYRERFQAKKFHILIRRLAQHYARKHNREADIEEEAKVCARAISKMQITGHTVIQTQWTDEGRVVNKSQSNKSCFLVKGDRHNPPKLLISQSESPSEDPFRLTHLYNILSSEFSLLQLCTGGFERDILSLNLDYLKIQLDQTEGFDVEDDFGILPQIGHFVPLSDHHLLDCGFGAIRESDYVAYQVYDPLDSGETGEAVYTYSMVTRVIDDGAGLYCNSQHEILVEARGRTEVVTRDKIFAFVRVSEVSGSLEYDDDTIDIHLFQEIVEQINATLDYATGLPQSEQVRRNNIIRRLCMKWNLFNASDTDDIRRDVSEHLKQALATRQQVEMEDVQLMLENSEASAEQTLSCPSHGHFLSQISSRVQRYQQCRRKQGENYRSEKEAERKMSRTNPNITRSHRGGASSFNIGDGSSHMSNPQRSLAHVWLRQAQHDLEAITGDSACDWRCLKAHQCVEKCLTAVLYCDDAERVKKNMSLGKLANALGETISAEMYRLVAELMKITRCDAGKLTYPDSLGFVPYQGYTEETARRMQEIAEAMLDWAKTTIKNLAD